MFPPIPSSEVVEKFPALRATISSKLILTLSEIKSGKVFRGVLWILGEYVEEVADIEAAMREVRKVLGEIPILASEQRTAEDLGEAGGVSLDKDGESSVDLKEKEKEKKEGAGRPRVLADGTYATESAYTTGGTGGGLGGAVVGAVKAKPPLRTLILGGDFFTGAVLAAALSKLVLRFAEKKGAGGMVVNTLRAEVCVIFSSSWFGFVANAGFQAMLIMTSIIRVGQSKFVTMQIDEDSNERIMNCIQTLSELEEQPAVKEIFLSGTKTAYSKMLGAQEVRWFFSHLFRLIWLLIW